MVKFYMSIVKSGAVELGALGKNINNGLIELDECNSTTKFIKDEWIEISEMKMKFLSKKALSERMRIHTTRLFERILDLKFNDKLSVIIDKFEETCSYININDKEEIIIKTKDGIVRSVSIQDIKSIENIEYYICMSKCLALELGTIVEDENGTQIIYPKGQRRAVDVTKLRRILKDEAVFLAVLPLVTRVEACEGRLFERISRLTLGDRCWLRTGSVDTTYKVIGKCVKGDSVEYSLKSADGTILNVNQSEICPQDIPDKIGDENTEEISRSVDDGKKCLAVPSIDPVSVECKKSGLVIINPQSVKTVKTEKKRIDTKRILVLNNHCNTALVKWRGLINGRASIGCALDIISDFGCNGTLNNEKLFICEDKKGVFMFLDENNQTCERVNGSRHEVLSKAKHNIIKEDSICCIEETKAPSFGYEGKQLTLNETLSGTCKWQALFNGIDCVVVEISNLKNIPGYKAGNLLKKIKLIQASFSNCILMAVNDIAATIQCRNPNVTIVNPSIIQSLDKGDRYDKSIAVKQGASDQFIATVKWKGRVNGEMCIGCELMNDCKYGTNGTFCERQIFNTLIGRGVLLYLNDSLDCCLRGMKGHNSIKTDVNKCIDGSCICCAEVKDRFRFNCNININQKIICSKIIYGTLKWIGLINGEECVGVETISYQYGTNGTFNKIKLFECFPKRGVLMKLEDIALSIHCSVNNIHIANSSCIKFAEKGKRYNRYLTMKQGNNSLVVILKWMGRVLKTTYLGCELSQDCQYGTDGSFNDYQLFQCANRRGVIVSLDDGVECCIKGDHNQIRFDDAIFINERCICCIEETNASKPYFNINKAVICSSNYRGVVKWRGIINGEEAIGLEIDNYKNGTNGTFNGWNIFNCQTKSGVLMRLNEIDPFLQCSVNKLSIINPTTIDSIKEGGLCNRILSIKRGLEYSFVTLKWEGNVNGKPCLGCELPSDCIYGTDGKYNDKQIFESSERRAVLVVADQDMQCCHTDLGGHSDISYFKSKCIDYNSICCAESKGHLPSSTDVALGNRVILWDGVCGICKWMGTINGEECIGVITHYCNGDFDLTERNKQLIEQILYPMTFWKFEFGQFCLMRLEDIVNGNVEVSWDATKFYDVVIDPSSVKSMYKVYMDAWNIDDHVEFRLMNSYNKYEGTLRWIGLVNGIYSALVEVDSLAEGEVLQRYVCTEKILANMGASISQKCLIVALNCINKSSVLESCISCLHKIIDSSTATIDVDTLMEIISIKDSNAVHRILGGWKWRIDLDKYPDVLSTLIGQNKFDIIVLMLNNFAFTDASNIELLKIARHFLSQGNFKTFEVVLRKCSNPNMMFVNGETFLTNLFKENVDQNLINRVISTNIFDVNSPNRDDYSPLILASERLMVLTVRFLVLKGAIKSYKNNAAMTVIFEIRKNINDLTTLQKAMDIADILTQDIRLDSNICSICMRNKINISFNCGHNSCDACARELITCPMCRENIVIRNPLFLN